MTLNIGIVTRCLNSPHIRGMGRYVYELLEQSKREGDLHWHMFGDDPRYPMTYPDGIDKTVDIFPFRGDRFHLWEQIGLPLRQKTNSLDLLHCTEGALPWWQPTPTVVTVHDTLAWAEPHRSATEKFYWETLLPAALHKATAVITISESSQNDILNKWPKLEKKLEVIPHGIGSDFFAIQDCPVPNHLAEKLGGAPYVVYVGGPMERKRFDWACDVLLNLNMEEVKLIACGFGENSVDKAVSKLPPAARDRVIFAPFLSEKELVSVYKNAIAALYPTLYEGFGFPAVEAQVSGTPVLFSPLGSLKELIGPLAIVLDPFVMDDWVKALKDIQATNPLELDNRRRAALSWADRYSWKKSFELHKNLYFKLANSIQ